MYPYTFLAFRFVLLTVLMVMLAGPSSAPFAAQPPAIPHAFYGPISIHGVDAPVGTIVSAQTSGGGTLIGVAGNPITTTAVGKYGGPDPFANKLIVQGAIDDGEAIFFFVNRALAQVRVVGQTLWLPSYPWCSGAITNLELRLAVPPPVYLPLVQRSEAIAPPIELAHDDGAREAWAGGTQGSVMAVRYAFSPPARVHSARFFLGGQMRPMRFIVWNGAWQELYSQTLTPNAPSDGGWWTWTLPAGAMGPQSEVYVGYQCLSDYSGSGPFVGYDTSQPKGETYAGPWPPQRRTDGNAMIRVMVQ